MNNEALYAKPPRQNRPLNNGVAAVSDALTPESLRTLRYELETFVCDGEYAKGLERILRSFVDNLERPEQPGVWVSGFYGSGKSHLVKMLRALWIDFTFPEDRATARGLINLTQPVKDLLHELSTLSKRTSGTHAASGTLGHGSSESVRLALLEIVLSSAGLSSKFHLARFELWLRRQGVASKVRAGVEAHGVEWNAELDHLHVSPKIHRALLTAIPDLSTDLGGVAQALDAQFRERTDISNQEMLETIRDALTLTPEGVRPFPLTLIALDEIQQYVGQDQARSYAIQEVTEACCKSFGGKLLFVGTGQMALAGTPNLQRLMGRFPVTIQLSDTDVETVIRQVILQKKPEVLPQLEATLNQNLGEISRHLEGTRLAHRNDDRAILVADYPLLPTRNRLWEKLLRAVDHTGTTAQLRNQVIIVLEAVIETADKPLGSVVPADFIFEQLSTRLLQSNALPRETHDLIRHHQKLHRDLVGAGDPTQAELATDHHLMSRLLALVFLIGKLHQDGPSDLGIRTTPDTLSDLLVEFLPDGSTSLRKRVPRLLEALEADGTLMRVEDEYRLQTKESAAWNNEFKDVQAQLLSDPTRLEGLRVDRLRAAVTEHLRSLTRSGGLKHGVSAEARSATLAFGANRPPQLDQALTLWVRDGWEEDEAVVESDARAAGSASPGVFVVLKRHASDELRRLLATAHAADTTLKVRAGVQGPEAEVARTAMATRKSAAEARLEVLLGEIFRASRVFQGGGQELFEGDLLAKSKLALEASMVRLYPKFDAADKLHWDKVIDRAKKGSEAALEAIGYSGDIDKHPVTSQLLSFVGQGKKGIDLRKHFEDSPFGWPRDAIDGGLYALVASGQIRATDSNGHPIDAKQLDRAKLPQCSFRTESITLTAAQRIQIRKVFNTLGVACNPGEELGAMPHAMAKLKALMAAAGGEGPRPALPKSELVTDLDTLHGNEQLLRVFERRDELAELTSGWKEIAEKIAARAPKWTLLEQLLMAAGAVADPVRDQVEAIKTQRLLLAEPDPVPSLLANVTDTLRQALVTAHATYEAERQAGETRLDQDTNWQALSPEQRHALRTKHQVLATPNIKTGTAADVLESLNAHPLRAWADRTAALPTRYDRLLAEAAELLTPDAVTVKVRRGTVKTQAELESWLEEARLQLEAALGQSKGAGVVIQ